MHSPDVPHVYTILDGYNHKEVLERFVNHVDQISETKNFLIDRDNITILSLTGNNDRRIILSQTRPEFLEEKWVRKEKIVLDCKEIIRFLIELKNGNGEWVCNAHGITPGSCSALFAEFDHWEGTPEPFIAYLLGVGAVKCPELNYPSFGKTLEELSSAQKEGCEGEYVWVYSDNSRLEFKLRRGSQGFIVGRGVLPL